MDRIVTPGKLAGRVAVPSSKSMAHRYLLCAALAKGESRVDNVTFSDDIKATLNGVAEMCIRDRPIGEVAARLREIEGGKRYGFAWQVGAFALVSAGFTLLFGGEWRDAVLAALCGAALKPLLRLMEGWRANFFFANLMGSALVAALALTSFRLGVPVHTDKVIIGTRCV